MLVAEYQKGGIVKDLKHGADDLLGAMGDAGQGVKAARKPANAPRPDDGK